ncbi:MAG: cadmium-translocating P-type ATPase [Firmicutes bacterium]|nr:cadmium-translocating P-type ATPase [Bacillota bacterium]
MSVDATMEQPKLRKFRVKNLDCADCAAKIQERFKQEPGLETAVLNFVTATIIVDPRYVQRAEEIMNSVEPGVVIDTQTSPEETGELAPSLSEYWPTLAVMGVSTLLFVLGLIYREALRETPYAWAEYAVFLTAYLLVGRKVLLAAFRNIRQGNYFDENFLMTIATFGAILIRELPEAVGVMLFYYIGEFFQNLAVNKSRHSIKALMNIRPEYANLLQNGETKRVSPETVVPGSVIVVKPGERVPLDGEIIKGTSFVDTSALTGESVPRRVEPGDEALAGMVNTSGVLTLKVTRPFGDSAVARVLDLVEKASSRKARTEKFITKFAHYYTPGVVATASAVAVLPPLFIPAASFEEWVYRALVLLVISCPCALMVSIPLGYFAGIGSASRHGVLVKGAQFLEALTQVATVVFDKTGTLSQGVFKVVAIRPEEGYSESDLLRIAAEVEVHSSHPIATSILEAYGRPVDESAVSDYQELAGHGVKAVVEGKRVYAGNARLMETHGVTPRDVQEAGTVVHVAVEGKYAGFLIIADELKPDAAQTIAALKKLGIKNTVMLTGDSESVAHQVAKDLQIDEVHANLLPEDKLNHLEEIIKEHGSDGKVAFVGDGINDSPVISRADVGIAVGGLGSDAAIEAADVVLMKGEPSRVADAIKIARRTRKIVVQNLVFALGIKLLFIFLGAVGSAGMWEAVFADVGVALLTVLNSTRALRTVS